MSPVDPPDGPAEDPPTLQRRDAPDTLVGPAANREIHAVSGLIERDEQTGVNKAAYAIGDVIGRGGGGEVLSAHDKRIGRDVALKRMRTMPSDDGAARFLREARIQARLDHPAIVPVYDLGRDAEGRPYFTMKRLAGTTLTQMLATPDAPRQHLLRAFADVCHAVDFAHSRSIVHRDLKPANIVLGDYGEVYVLDWGLARVVEDPDRSGAMDDIDSLDYQLADNELVGTPGYMAPEQIATRDQVGRAADVYALASILFEIVAGEPLHPRGQEAVASTLGGEVAKSAAVRRPDRSIPPELDTLCVAGLAMSPSARPTARELAARVEAFLDGDRDVARRRTLALEELWRARAAMTAGNRAEAMRAAGRSLALDPETTGAAELVTALMLEPPSEPPPELVAALRDSDSSRVKRHAVTAIAAYLAIASFLPLAMWNGIRRWDVVLGVFGVAVAMAIAAWRIHRRPERGVLAMLLYAFGNVVLVALLSRMIGPFTFVPAIACVITMSVMAYPAFSERPWLLIAVMLLGFAMPIALELLGQIPMTWEIEPGRLISHAGALVVEGTPTITLLVMASLVTIGVAGVHSAAITKTSRRATRQLVAQAWHLRQLLPSA